MLKELYESFKRQWAEWCALRWLTHQNAYHYRKESDRKFLPGISAILSFSGDKIHSIVAHVGTEKIKLFGIEKTCTYIIRVTRRGDVLVIVDLFPFFDQLRLLKTNIWNNMEGYNLTEDYPMAGAGTREGGKRSIECFCNGSRLVLTMGDGLTIEEHVQYMMEYFINLNIPGHDELVSKTPLTDSLYKGYLVNEPEEEPEQPTEELVVPETTEEENEP